MENRPVFKFDDTSCVMDEEDFKVSKTILNGLIEHLAEEGYNLYQLECLIIDLLTMKINSIRVRRFLDAKRQENTLERRMETSAESCKAFNSVEELNEFRNKVIEEEKNRFINRHIIEAESES